MARQLLNDLAAADPRVDLALTPVADGLLIACPKATDHTSGRHLPAETAR